MGALVGTCKKDLGSAAAWEGQSCTELWFMKLPGRLGSRKSFLCLVTRSSGIFQLSSFPAHLSDALSLIYCTQHSLEFGSSGSSCCCPLQNFPQTCPHPCRAIPDPWPFPFPQSCSCLAGDGTGALMDGLFAPKSPWT